MNFKSQLALSLKGNCLIETPLWKSVIKAAGYNVSSHHSVQHLARNKAAHTSFVVHSLSPCRTIADYAWTAANFVSQILLDLY